jgi:hypothetical protein
MMQSNDNCKMRGCGLPLQKNEETDEVHVPIAWR